MIVNYRSKLSAAVNLNFEPFSINSFSWSLISFSSLSFDIIFGDKVLVKRRFTVIIGNSVYCQIIHTLLPDSKIQLKGPGLSHQGKKPECQEYVLEPIWKIESVIVVSNYV